MGGKKLAEKSRKYEKDRRDRFNNQFIELSKLLPDFDTSVVKITKAEIIGRAIQYLQDTQTKSKKLENDFEIEKTKIQELQNKVAGLLQIIKELIKLLHKSNINFPASLPVDDFKLFKEAYLKCKRKCDDNSGNGKKKKINDDDDCSEIVSDLDFTDNEMDTSASPTNNETPAKSVSSTECTSSELVSSTITSSTRTPVSQITSATSSITTAVMNVGTPNMLRLDSNSLILPNGNILAVNGLQNTVLNTLNNPQTLFIHKPVTVPTFIMMQNNSLLPVSSMKQVTAPQKSQKPIVPKQMIMSTKTTFINKKPIPAVGFYKSNVAKEGRSKFASLSLKKRFKRSKGILVKYPKRKAPTNKAQAELKTKPSVDKSEVVVQESEAATTTEPCEKESINTSSSFTNLENSYSVSTNAYHENESNTTYTETPRHPYTEAPGDAPFTESTNDINKNYPCSNNLFDTQDTPNSSEFGAKGVQFIDFFESTSTRSNNSDTGHALDSTEYSHTELNGTPDKVPKSRPNNFKNNGNFNDLNEICSVKSSFVSQDSYCNLLGSTEKDQGQSKHTQKTILSDAKSGSKTNNYHHLPSSCVSDESVLQYVPSDPVNKSNENYTAPIFSNTIKNKSIPVGEAETTLKNKPTKSGPEKEIGPLTIQCDLENKTISKELTLPLIEEKKNYESVSSFDELSNDLFTTLQVPSSGQNTDSISPTAAFLLTFPYVSSCKNADLLPDHEHEEDSSTATPSTTILQIGNLESPSTLLFSSSKFATREGQKSYSCKADESAFPYDSSAAESSAQRKEKLKDKETDFSKQFTPVGRTDTWDINFTGQTMMNKSTTVSQNMPFYPPTCTASTFPTYNIFTKYNEIPPVASSYYTLGSQSFSTSKPITTEPIPDFNTWASMPSVYNQDTETVKEKTKRDKCTSTHMPSFKNTKLNEFTAFGLSQNDLSVNSVQNDRKMEKAKKPQKQPNNRLVNWMTSPDLKNTDTSQSLLLSDPFMMQKDETPTVNTLLNTSNISSVANNTFGNVSGAYSSDYFLDNQNYSDTTMNSCKVTYTCANSNYTWTTSKPSLPTISHLDTHNIMIPSTLPTLVGDLALGNSGVNPSLDKVFNSYDSLQKKYSEEKKKDECNKSFYKSSVAVGNEYSKSTQSTFLSVTQLVDDKDRMNDASKSSHKPSSKYPEKHLNLNTNEGGCTFDSTDGGRDKCNFIRNKENYSVLSKASESTEFHKKNPYTNSCSSNSNLNKSTSETSSDSITNSNIIKSNQNISIKCKAKDNLKYNVNRCLSKENKKDTRQSIPIQTPHTKHFEYSVPQNANTNPLSNKNSNYSAESLISSSSHQNVCPPQNYFPYDNSASYSNCMSTDYTRKRIDTSEAEPALSNVGYYTNTNYVYHNNFQSFNNYGLSNQCYNNYSSQIPHANLQKKSQKEETQNKSETDWCKESFPSHYNNIVSSDFSNPAQNKAENKCKQPYSNNKYNMQKNSNINSMMYNSKYYQYGASSSTGTMDSGKSSCSFNSTYAFNQTPQQCAETNSIVPNYEMKSNRNNEIVNSGHSNNVHSATSLTSFNLSAIFPEINDKHCNQNKINTVGNEKKDASYGSNKVAVDEMNYGNYLMQPMESNQEPISVYGSSGFQMQHFTNFIQRKSK